LDVIAAYQKQLRKTRDEYVAVGERGAAMLPQLDFEIGLCARFLPQAAGEDEVRAAVREAITRLSITDPKQGGRLMGELMKANKGKFESGMVKKIVDEELAAK